MKSIISILNQSIYFCLAIVALGTMQLSAAEANLDSNNVAISGYDPVSYFSAGPQKGDKTISSDYQSATYYFSSKTNQDTFLANPEKYAPAYGGWCAWAMLGGDKASIDPLSYKIIAGKNYLYHKSFFGGDTLKSWNKKAQKTPEPQLVQQADASWSQL